MGRKPPTENPALRRFGRELARLRGLSDMSQAVLGKRLGVSGALVGHIERAERTPSRRFAESADEALEAGGQLIALWKDVQHASYPEYAGSFMEALPHASMMREYHPLVVPGLLQTEDYARAFVRASNPMETEDYVERLVEVRMRSQDLLTDSDRPVIWAIITEIVLRSLASNPGILLGQINRLLDLMESGRVRLQLIPDAVAFDTHPGMDGPFIILSLPDRQEVAYIEGVVAGTMITKHESVERLSLKFGSLQSFALSPIETAEYLKEIRGKADGYHMAHVQLQQREWRGMLGGRGDSADGSTPRHQES